MSVFEWILTIYIIICILGLPTILWPMYDGYKRCHRVEWLMLLFIPFFPFVLPFMIKFFIKEYKKGKGPMPVSPYVLALESPNLVSDKGKVITIDEYNKKHGTKYTLGDVYSKDVLDQVQNLGLAHQEEGDCTANDSQASKLGKNEEDDIMPELPPFTPKFLYPNALYYEMPLKGTKYVEHLNNSIALDEERGGNEAFELSEEENKKFGSATEKVTAEYFNINMLSHAYTTKVQIYNEIKNCYISALKDGIYEAANNLAVISLNIEDNEDECLRYLNIAIEHGVCSAMANKARVLHIRSLPETVLYLKEMENHIPVCYECLYDLAVYYFYGHSLNGNPLKEDREHAIKLLKRIIVQKENVYKDVFDLAKKFLETVKHANIYALKAKNFFFDLSMCSLRRIKFKKMDDDCYWDSMYKDLSCIKPLAGCKFEISVPNRDVHGDVSALYIRSANGERLNISNGATVCCSEMGAWEAYLFIIAPTQMPIYGMGCRSRRTIIFGNDDLKTIAPLKTKEANGSIKGLYLEPEVELKGNIAIIYCYYWSQWKGLVREKATIIFDKTTVKEIHLIDDKIVYSYKDQNH